MKWVYDGHSHTVYDAETGDVIARDVSHQHGYLVRAAPDLARVVQQSHDGIHEALRGLGSPWSAMV